MLGTFMVPPSLSTGQQEGETQQQQEAPDFGNYQWGEQGQRLSVGSQGSSTNRVFGSLPAEVTPPTAAVAYAPPDQKYLPIQTVAQGQHIQTLQPPILLPNPHKTLHHPPSHPTLKEHPRPFNRKGQQTFHTCTDRPLSGGWGVPPAVPPTGPPLRPWGQLGLMGGGGPLGGPPGRPPPGPPGAPPPPTGYPQRWDGIRWMAIPGPQGERGEQGPPGRENGDFERKDRINAESKIDVRKPDDFMGKDPKPTIHEEDSTKVTYTVSFLREVAAIHYQNLLDREIMSGVQNTTLHVWDDFVQVFGEIFGLPNKKLDAQSKLSWTSQQPYESFANFIIWFEEYTF
ncbi:hypothetical protein BT96DRAFT_994899 [Gymnopus androsaceus JB14]|uniref:Uncharacterized protein n=1 Tax=Gymnopus androsaceus JB14 TaxID=1447944 RepID=A0A6A4HN28_9AGAR|nr:hypothetical protein BT96DRAFT_994899 [Gymnopus androsaceus JB14]